MTQNRRRQQQRGLRNLSDAIGKVAPCGTIAVRLLLGVLARAVAWEITHPAKYDDESGACAVRIHDGFGDWQDWDVPGAHAIARALRQVYGNEPERTKR